MTNFKKIFFSLFTIFVLLVAGTGHAVAQAAFDPTGNYKPVQPDVKRDLSGRPLTEGVLQPQFLKGWASLAVTETFNFGYNSYQKRLEQSAKYFTPEGWKNFLQALDEAQLLEFVVKNKQQVTTVLTGAPVIAAEGVENNVYTWHVELPVETSYAGDTNIETMPMIVALTIIRTADKNSATGVGIQQWLAMPASSADAPESPATAPDAAP